MGRDGAEEKSKRNHPSSANPRKKDMTRRRSSFPAATPSAAVAAIVSITVAALPACPLQASAHKKFTFTTTHANELEEGSYQGGVESQIKHIIEETLKDKPLAAGSSVDKATIHVKKGREREGGRERERKNNSRISRYGSCGFFGRP